MRVTALELAKRLREEQETQHRWIEQHFGTIDDGHFAAVAMNDKEFVLAPIQNSQCRYTEDKINIVNHACLLSIALLPAK